MSFSRLKGKIKSKAAPNPSAQFLLFRMTYSDLGSGSIVTAVFNYASIFRAIFNVKPGWENIVFRASTC